MNSVFTTVIGIDVTRALSIVTRQVTTSDLTLQWALLKKKLSPITLMFLQGCATFLIGSSC